MDNTKGYTLIEIIIYIAILSIVLVITTIIIVMIIQTQNKVITIANANETTRISLKEITQNIEDGYQVELPNPGATQSNKLTVETDSTGDEISFYTQNGIIYSQYNSDTPLQVSSSNVFTYNLSFEEEANSGISPTIFITLTEENVGSTGVKTSKTYETTATQRR